MKYTSWARIAYLTGLVLAILFFMPQTTFPLIAAKAALMSIGLLIAGVLLVVARWRGEGEALSMTPLWLFVLPAAYLLSWAITPDKAIGIIGTGIEADTLVFTTLIALTGALGAWLFRSAHQVWMLVRVLIGALVVMGLFQLIVLLGGTMPDRATNLIGKWNDFGSMMMLLGFWVLVELQYGRLNSRMRLGAWLTLVAVLGLLAMVNFGVAWSLLLAVSASMVVAQWLTRRSLAWTPLIVALVSVAFLFFGATINLQLSKVIPVTSLEVRPSLQSTYGVLGQAHGTSPSAAAVGTGPNTFGREWLMYKPAEVNQSQFWNLDFSVGFSTLLTALESVGFVGALAWLVPAFLVLMALWRTRGGEGRVLAWAVGGATLVLWGVIALYVPSLSVLLVSFAVAGAALGLLSHGRAMSVRLNWSVMTLVVVLLVGVGFVSARRTLAEVYVGQAADNLSAGNIDDAQTAVATSVHIEANPENLRLATSIGTAKLQQIAAAAKPGTEQTFTDVLKQTVAAGQQAIVLDQNDYRSYISLGQVYDFLATNKVQGAYQNARGAYDAAAKLSPLNPAIPLMIARLEATAGTEAAMQAALKQSLTLKADYTDAILFLAQVDIARNDLASALNDTKAAVRSAPGVPSVWLELGLLYYAAGDTKNAIPPLEQALKLQPDYANAQYFLALSYAAQGRKDDAYALFKQLQKTNPDSTDVKSAIANMEAGRAPLDNGTTTASTTPKK